MNVFIIITLIFFIILKIYELFFSKSIDPRLLNNQFDINSVNDFIRKETNFEVSKWITANKYQRNANTGDPSFITQMTNSEEIKKRTTAITSMIADKMSPALHSAFNKYYKKNPQKVDNRVSIDVALYEYIARYVFFVFRRLTYDITKTIDSEEYKEVKLSEILNIYIASLEETIYAENNIYLISEEQNNVETITKN
jgi:hypothetical protein